MPERDQERGQRDHQGDGPGLEIARPAPQREDGDPDERQEDDDGQPGHRQALSPRNSRSATAPSRNASAYDRTNPRWILGATSGGLDHVLGDLVHRPVDHPVVDHREDPTERLAGMLDQPGVERVEVEGVREPPGELGLAFGERLPVDAARGPDPERHRDRRDRERDRDGDQGRVGKRCLAVFDRAHDRLEEAGQPAALGGQAQEQPADDREEREDHERRLHRRRGLVRVLLAAPAAEERQEQWSRDVQRRQEGADRRQDPRQLSIARGGEPDDLVLREEARERRDAGERQRADREPGGRERHVRPQASHPPHVGLVVQAVQHVAGREEEQGLVERVADEQQHGSGVEAHPGREEHEPDLAHRRVRERALQVELADRRERGVQRRDQPDHQDDRERRPGELEQHVRAHDEVDAGRHHRRRVDQRRHRRGTLHRVGEPDVQRQLRRLADRAGEQEQGDRGGRALRQLARAPAEHGVEVQRPDVQPDQHDPEQHRGVADPRRDEGLLRSARGRWTLEPEPDQQVRAQARRPPTPGTAGGSCPRGRASA